MSGTPNSHGVSHAALLKEFENWYMTVASRAADGTPKGTIAGALVVLERLKSSADFAIDAHTAKGGSQIRGTGGGAIKKILLAYGESRPFASEGGRTNRGLRGHIDNMLKTLCEAGVPALDESDRVIALTLLQRYLVERVQHFHNQRRLEPAYNPALSARQHIADILELARRTGKEGPVAQYLVGAKLQLRFPDVAVSNESYSTADAQLGRAGDFKFGDTAFHVTVAPALPVYDKCENNLSAGLRVYLLVPDRILLAARQFAEQRFPGRVAVESVESFVGQNIEELGHFSHTKLKSELRNLLEIYNKRVEATEFDKSMMIVVPANL